MKSFQLSLVASALIFQPLAFADNDDSEIEKIEVRGELLPTSAQQATNSVDVLNKELIEQLGASHIQDVLFQFGNVNFASGSSRARFFQIRGIGERSQFVDPVNPSVGMAIDGIDYSGIGNAAGLFDIEQMEIFKGPQGTNIGANAMAGFINLSSTGPGTGYDPKLRLEVGNYGYTQIAAAYGDDISDDSRFRVSVSKVDGDGYIENTHLDREDTNGFDELVLRSAYEADMTRNWTMKAVLHKIDIDNGYDAFSLDNNRTTLSDQPGFDRQDTTAFALTNEFTGLDDVDLKVFVSHSTSDLDYGYDEDWAYGQYNEDWSFTGIHPDGYASTDHYFREQDATQIDINAMDKSQDWVVGFYYQNKESDLLRQYTWLDNDFDSSYQVSNIALYGERRHEIGDDVFFSYGLRLEQYEGDYVDSNGVSVNTDEIMWGGHFSANKVYNNAFMTYFRVSRGFKAGGVNGEALARLGDDEFLAFSGVLLENDSFDPELLNNVELGLRYHSKSRRLKANATLFYSDRSDMQIKQWLTNDQKFVGYLSNAPKGVNTGVETTLSYDVSDDIRTYAGFALLETEVERYERRDGDMLVDIDGREQAHAPDYQYHFGIDWQVSDRISLNTNVTGRGGYYYSFSHDQTADAVDLLNLSLMYKGELFDVTLWARNLTDEDYGVRGFYFGNDPRDGYTDKLYEQLGEPRVFGASLDFIF